jgi:RNA polymerase sigma-70 factor (ECF subfamily)
VNGHPDNPEALLRERAWLGALARQLVRRGELADEAAHDALSAAVTQPGPRSAGVRGWLAAILKRQLAGRRRADHRRLLREHLAARPEAEPSVASTVVRFEAQRAVADAVLALGEPYRTAVLLRFWDGLSPGAIGRQLGVPVETVRTRLKRGLGMLRERLDHEHGGDRQAWLVPVWLAGRRAGSAMAYWWMGVLLMTTMQKLLVGGVVLAAAAVLWLSMPWLAPSGQVPVAAVHEPASVAVQQRIAGDAAVADESEARIDRVVVAAATPPTGLLVKGRLVDDETDAPLAGLPVRLVRWPRGVEPEVEAVSAADGEFVLAGPRATEPAPREVLVQVPEYALALVHANPAREAEGAQEVDVGAIRLVRGTLFSGQVVDPDGRGVPGAQLLLPMVSSGYGGGWGPQNMLERSVHLGAGEPDGRFRLLHPVAPGIDHGNLLFAVAPHGIGWCRIEPSKQRRDVTDLVLRLRPAGALRVAVVMPDGQPAAGVMVRAMPRFGPIGIDKDGWRLEVAADELAGERFRGRTDERGELQLPHLPIGEPNLLLDRRADQRRYELWVEADGLPEQPLTPVELQPGAETRVAVHLLASRQIVVTALVRDDLGAPIADAVVTCLAAVARTDASGQATLSVEPRPELGVWASRAGHWRQHESIEPGTASAAGVTLVLPRVRPLEGRVVDQRGVGAAGMSLFVEQRKVGSTDAEGRFHIGEFPLGPRRLIVATAAGMDPQWIGEQAPETVDAEAGPVTIVLQRRLGSVDVRVAVVDAATGSALEPLQSRLSLRNEKHGDYFLTKQVETERGVITAKGMPAGRWRLDVVTATGPRGSLVFDVTEGQPATDLRLELQAPGTILGRLQFGSLTVPANVTLHVAHATLDATAFVQFRYPGSWRPCAETQTVTGNEFGGTGQLRMQPLRNASFRLDAVDPTDELVFRVLGEGITGEATLRIEPGQTRELSIEVRAKATTGR